MEGFTPDVMPVPRGGALVSASALVCAQATLVNCTGSRSVSVRVAGSVLDVDARAGFKVSGKERERRGTEGLLWNPDGRWEIHL